MGYGGIKAFAFCDSVIETIESLWNTFKFFYKAPWTGSGVPPYMEKEFMYFMKESMGVEFEVRETQKVEIDPDTVQSGDYLTTWRPDGVSAIISYGTGSRVSHNVMALRFTVSCILSNPQILKSSGFLLNNGSMVRII